MRSYATIANNADVSLFKGNKHCYWDNIKSFEHQIAYTNEITVQNKLLAIF